MRMTGTCAMMYLTATQTKGHAMQVTVRYQETHVVSNTINVDDTELLEYYNENFDPEMVQYANSVDDITNLPEVINEFLEDGDQHVWVTDHPEEDVFAEKYDQEIVEVRV